MIVNNLLVSLIYSWLKKYLLCKKIKVKLSKKIVYLAGDKKKLTALSWEIVWVVLDFKKISMQVKNQETCIKILEIKFYISRTSGTVENSIFFLNRKKRGETESGKKTANKILKEGLNIAAIKSNENGLIWWKSLRSLSVALITAIPVQNVTLLLIYCFSNLREILEPSTFVFHYCSSYFTCQGLNVETASAAKYVSPRYTFRDCRKLEWVPRLRTPIINQILARILFLPFYLFPCTVHCSSRAQVTLGLSGY